MVLLSADLKAKTIEVCSVSVRKHCRYLTKQKWLGWLTLYTTWVEGLSSCEDSKEERVLAILPKAPSPSPYLK